MVKLSLKHKLSIIIATVLTLVIVIVCILNLTFFEKFYINNRKDKLVSSYNNMKAVIEKNGFAEDDIKAEMLRLSKLHNINVFIVDINWKTAYSTQNNAEYTYRWLQRFMFSNDENIEVLADNNEYTLKRGYDYESRMSYMIIYGTMTDGTQIVMQLVIESIRENVRLFNRFILITGAVVLIISMFVVYIVASKFTKPVNELSHIAKEMSDLNFDVKYTGSYNDEIGVLGQSINLMSDNLKSNIAKLKQANYDLEKDIENKNKMADRQREFIANVSHELKTPIALIQGYAEGLKDGVADDKDSMDFYCEVISDEADKMNRLVKSLLTLDGIESGSKETNIERFDLSEMINSIIRSNYLSLTQKAIKVVVNIESGLHVWYDKLHIEEVFNNFFVNAINHSNGLIKVDVIKKDKILKISIYNSGELIPEGDLEHIWEKFYKVDKARTREYGGNGIGLSIVKAILDTYGMQYGAENEKDGVNFWFELECV